MKKIKLKDTQFLIIQLVIVPVSAFFAVLFNASTLKRFKAIYPEYPKKITLGLPKVPEHLILLHSIGGKGIILISAALTLLMILFTLFANPRVSKTANPILLTISIIFLLGLFISYIIGLLSLTMGLG
jgi:hypothetical protein